MWHFVHLSVQVNDCKTSTKPLRMLTHVLLSSLPCFHLTAYFCRLCPSLDSYLKPTILSCPLLSTASLCLLWDLPSPLHFRSRGKSHPLVLCVGFAPKQTKRFSERRQDKRKWMPPIFSHTHTHTHAHTHTHTHTYIYIYIYICERGCVCVCPHKKILIPRIFLNKTDSTNNQSK